MVLRKDGSNRDQPNWFSWYIGNMESSFVIDQTLVFKIWWGVIYEWKSRHKPFGKASWSPRSEICFDWSRIRRIQHQKLHYGLQLEQSVNTYFLIVTAWIHISWDEKWHTDTRKNLTLFECWFVHTM